MAAVMELLRSLPKAELHVHLEGSLRPATLMKLAKGLTRAEIDERLRYHDFAGFLQAFIWSNQFLARPEAYVTALEALCEELHQQGVGYAEVILSAGVVRWMQLPLDEVYGALWEASQKAPLRVRWIVDAVRQFGVEPAEKVAEFAIANRTNGIVAYGIGGDEARGPASWFADVFREVRRQGLKLVPHAGETVGPESVWAALEMGADRIGHGFRAIEDPALVEHLAKHRVPLEISVTSNVRTGVVARVEDHPVRLLYEAGVPVLVNTDDPALFDTTLLDEFALWQRLGFSHEELQQLCQDSLRYGFDAA